MAARGVKLGPECHSTFQELKLGKSIKWVIYKISDDSTEILVEETSTQADYDVFRQKLVNAKGKNRNGEEGPGGRYAIYDVEYEEAGEGKRNKIVFISWSPDNASQFQRMVYASSKESFRLSLTGLSAEIQANDPEDLTWDNIKSRAAKGR